MLLRKLKMNVIASLRPQQKKNCRESESESYSFDRFGVSCENAQTVQFLGGVEKCPVTQKTALSLANRSTHELQLN